MYGLTLFGDPRPIELANPERMPKAYVELLETWGPGTLFGTFELPDPTAEAGRWDVLQARFKLRGLAERNAGRWAQLTDEDLATGLVLGVHVLGDALLALGERMVWLYRDGKLADRPFKQFVVHRGDGVWSADEAIPAIYVTDPSRRPALFAALLAGNEAAADKALVKITEAAHVPTEMAAIALELATTTEIAVELRAQYIHQCLRIANRVEKVVTVAQLRALCDAIEAGTPSAELLQPLTSRAVATGVFAGEADQIEVALLEELAAHPEDDATRLVLADHLEEAGEHERATVLRAQHAAIPALADAKERGFIARAGVQPVDGPALLRAWMEQWATDDPQTSIAPLGAAAEALHPQERQGYAMLIATASDERSREYLGKEYGKAWPMLVLALRSPLRRRAAEVIASSPADPKGLTPYMLSVILRPTTVKNDWGGTAFETTLAESFALKKGKLTAADIDTFVAWLAPDSPLPRIHTAAALLANHAKDDRVFEGYLRHFCEVSGVAIRAIAKRKKEPRVVEVLTAQWKREEAGSLRGNVLAYSRDYGVLASYLARLGVPGMKEAYARYKKTTRINENKMMGPRERM